MYESEGERERERARERERERKRERVISTKKEELLTACSLNKRDFLRQSKIQQEPDSGSADRVVTSEIRGPQLKSHLQLI